ncbi:uncharacterized protein N7479_009664 [Penicillium vulpinum]|uniref:Uncharacterized protein n=1 Tax=Penicillium vulpinum TaxID=29845 RepID=A0A1V6RFV8_9EURO|nr:uncharacterized protein N7479_009664 [Penicillium vulpinum]KAJ5951251.1 hypothetical protein N7479_009664 [Penicillium vulpinum]OQE00398.1 hypothetical protein PENVUL_c052G08743 [Penicillium vulpinum]
MAASNSTALVSWQLEDNGRSTWALVWSCLATIFACTWTVLHPDLPRRNSPTVRIIIANLGYWLLAIFFPEYVFVNASCARYRAMLLKNVCNEAQKARYLESVDRDSWLSKRARPLEQVQNRDSADPHSFRTEWTLRKCFCISAGGLALQSQDGWIYVLRRSDMQPFIQAGIIEDIDFHDRDVEDRAKADSLGKTFTVIQTSWFLADIIARWVNSLPVAPIELATIAYIACGLMMYAMWWYKPKDMSTPITIYVRYDRNSIPTDLLNHTATNPHGWVHIYA